LLQWIDSKAATFKTWELCFDISTLITKSGFHDPPVALCQVVCQAFLSTLNPMPEDRALFRKFPALESKLPFVELGLMPTPVQAQEGLANALDLADLWIKRDDLAAADYGGNKIRKLEFLLADARQAGCSHIITFGGFGSNHALATAIQCKKLGFHCSAILTPEPATDAVRRTLRHHLQLGTRLEVAKTYADTRTIADRLCSEYGTGRSYEIPFGGSSWMGTVGFVDAGLELAEQVKAGELPSPDCIYLACGTAGSSAGLALGLMLAGIKTTIQAVQVTPESLQLAEINKRLFGETFQKLKLRDSTLTHCDFDDADLHLRTDQLGQGYAIPTVAGREATTLLQEFAGIPSSLTYTAKAMAALIADARRGLLENKNVLFWNTYNSQPLPAFANDLGWQKLPLELHNLFVD
jgi:D-cysteine desulfhydrase